MERKYNETYLIDLRKVVNAIPLLEKLKEKRILIIGATGMIGSAVVDCILTLEDNSKFDMKVFAGVRSKEKAYKRFRNWNKNCHLEIISFDTEESIMMPDQIDYIVYAAGYSSPSYYASNPVEVMKVNFQGMAHVLEFAAQKKVEKVIYISSSEVYGEKEYINPWTEESMGQIDFLEYRSCYASAKRATETLCMSYIKEYGVNCIIARPGHIYGPTVLSTDTKASSQFASSARNGENIVLKSSGDQLRSYCYVLDCASAIITLLTKGKLGEVYNISNPNSIVSIRQLADSYAKKSGVKVTFTDPTDMEKAAFNPMNNSSLNSDRLLKLGWKGLFDIDDGVEHDLIGIY